MGRCDNLPRPAGLAEWQAWISSRPVTPANHFPTLANDVGTAIIATFGQQFVESSRALNPKSCFSKTLTATSHWGSGKCSGQRLVDEAMGDYVDYGKAAKQIIALLVEVRDLLKEAMGKEIASNVQ